MGAAGCLNQEINVKEIWAKKLAGRRGSARTLSVSALATSIQGVETKGISVPPLISIQVMLQLTMHSGGRCSLGVDLHQRFQTTRCFRSVGQRQSILGFRPWRNGWLEKARSFRSPWTSQPIILSLRPAPVGGQDPFLVYATNHFLQRRDTKDAFLRRAWGDSWTSRRLVPITRICKSWEADPTVIDEDPA